MGSSKKKDKAGGQVLPRASRRRAVLQRPALDFLSPETQDQKSALLSQDCGVLCCSNYRKSLPSVNICMKNMCLHLRCFSQQEGEEDMERSIPRLGWRHMASGTYFYQRINLKNNYILQPKAVSWELNQTEHCSLA